ncbi:hypothetical protein LZ32DRAFT_660305 [Colletotrichum eremochloae]|nr:hypothetical protein LZ32DRAFT_660305 [Colletotrichum eremochloae]
MSALGLTNQWWGDEEAQIEDRSEDSGPEGHEGNLADLARLRVGALDEMLAVVAENPIDLSRVLKLGTKLEDRLSEVHEMLAYAIRMGEGRVDRLLQVEAPRAALRLRSTTENHGEPVRSDVYFSRDRYGSRGPCHSSGSRYVAEIVEVLRYESERTEDGFPSQDELLSDSPTRSRSSA